MAKNNTGTPELSDALSTPEPVINKGFPGIIVPDFLAGISEPEEPFWSIDPGEGKGDAVWDGVKTRWFNDFADIIREAAAEGIYTLKTERSFANFNVLSRAELIDLARGLGVEILTINTIQTSRKRTALGFEKKKGKAGDELDAQVLYLLGCDSNVHFKVASTVEYGWKEFSEACNYVRMKSRRSGDEAQELVDFVADLVGSAALKRHAANICNADGKLSKPLVASVIVAAANTVSRRDFERLMGLYGNGHACMFRSDAMHWGYRLRRDRTTLTAFRRSLRWLRSEIMKHREKIMRRFSHLIVTS
jgi:hypothetical protein